MLYCTGHNSPLLQYVTKSSSPGAVSRRTQIGEIFQILSAVLPRIDTLVSRSHVNMSDAIIIPAVYIAIGPFFVVEFGASGSTQSGKSSKEKTSIVLSALGGNSALRGLRLSALALIRSVSIVPPDHLCNYDPKHV
jgi:cohesin loading factor subunit SCC2